jgi:hypothetical protein
LPIRFPIQGKHKICKLYVIWVDDMTWYAVLLTPYKILVITIIECSVNLLSYLYWKIPSLVQWNSGWETCGFYSYSTGQVTLDSLWNVKVHYHNHRSLPFHLILSHLILFSYLYLTSRICHHLTRQKFT